MIFRVQTMHDARNLFDVLRGFFPGKDRRSRRFFQLITRFGNMQWWNNVMLHLEGPTRIETLLHDLVTILKEHS